MEPVTLSKPWLEHAIGDVVEVDPLRAQWLKNNGYGAAEELPRVEPELPSPFPGIEITAPVQIPDLAIPATAATDAAIPTRAETRRRNRSPIEEP